MTDKEKILAKIGSLLNETNYEPYTNETFGRIQSLKELKSYIDSLPEEPVSEDLEEAAEKHALQCHSKKASVGTLATSMYDFKAGANWQKEQMMKDAVEGEITDDVLCKHLCYDAGKFLEAWDKFNIGDKVKIIVIKEE